MNQTERPIPTPTNAVNPPQKWDVTSVTVTNRTITVIFPENQPGNESAEQKSATEPSV